MKVEVIQSQQAPAAIGTYSQAAKVANTVYLSGQIPLDPVTMQLVSDDFSEQLHQVFKNLRAVCTAAGGSLDHLVKLTIYLLDLDEFAVVNDIMSQYCESPYPARAAIAVKALPKGAKVEIDGIMQLP